LILLSLCLGKGCPHMQHLIEINFSKGKNEHEFLGVHKGLRGGKAKLPI
jgi:hypothetical protein